VWLIAIVVINPRNPETPATVPLAMLAALAVTRLIAPGLLMPARGGIDDESTPRQRGVPRAAFAAMALRSLLEWDTSTRALARDERATMRWAGAQTAPSRRFLVVSFAPSDGVRGDVRCLDQWGADSHTGFSRVHVRRESCCPGLMTSLPASPAHRRV
jgi:hypothetical protein